MPNQFSSVFDQMNSQREQSQPSVWDNYYAAMSLLGQSGGRPGTINALSGTEPRASSNLDQTIGGIAHQDDQQGQGQGGKGGGLIGGLL